MLFANAAGEMLVLLFFIAFAMLIADARKQRVWERRIRPHWKNATYLFWHKLYVWRAGRVLRVSKRRLLLHDLSKLSRAEWSPYAFQFHYPHEDDQAKQDAYVRFKTGWKHHIERNTHHPEYHTRNGRKGSDMPDADIREMCADWWAAGKAQGKCEVGELSSWWMTQRERITKLIGEKNAIRAGWYVSCLSFWETVGVLPDDVSFD